MSKQTIPFFSLARQVKNSGAEFKSAIEKVIECQQFIGGPFVEKFEKALSSYLDVHHAISCNSGTDALWMALKALDLKKDSIVLTTPFSFIASSSEIVAHEAHPVFIDIDEQTFNLSPSKLRTWLEQNATLKQGVATHNKTGLPIAGMVAVDIFGQTADYNGLQEVAKEWNLWTVADCAQSIGASLDGKKAGTFGTISTFSFYPTKNLGAWGDAGCCTTNDPFLAEKLLQLRNHGRKTHYDYLGQGINSRMDSIQAALLTQKLTYADQYNSRRREIAAMYDEALASLPFVKTPEALTGEHVYHQYSIQVVNETGISMREELEKHLLDRGVQTRIFYPKVLPEITFLNTHPELQTEYPVAQQLTQTILALPIWPELEDSEVQYVIDSIKSMPYHATAEAAQGVEHHEKNV